MELKEAIEEVKRVTPMDDPWTGREFCQDSYDDPSYLEVCIATILNAVVKGELKYVGD